MTDFYHCTKDDHGPAFQVESRPPQEWERSGEPDVPRLCVSPSVPQCIAAVSYWIRDVLYVYVAEKPEHVISPNGVWDQEFTDEHWIPPGARLRKSKTIEPSTTRPIYERRDKIMADIHKKDTIIFRIITLFAACEALPEHTSPDLAVFVNRHLTNHGIQLRIVT